MAHPSSVISFFAAALMLVLTMNAGTLQVVASQDLAALSSAEPKAAGTYLSLQDWTSVEPSVKESENQLAVAESTENKDKSSLAGLADISKPAMIQLGLLLACALMASVMIVQSSNKKAPNLLFGYNFGKNTTKMALLLAGGISLLVLGLERTGIVQGTYGKVVSWIPFRKGTTVEPEGKEGDASKEVGKGGKNQDGRKSDLAPKKPEEKKTT